ncbi:unnamed protein product [Arabidopsis halleri]
MLKGFTRSSTSPQLCSLYFKGLVGDDSLAGFGVAICGHRDDLLFQLNGPIHGSNITVFEAELIALKRGLTEAAEGLKASFPIFVAGNSIRYAYELARATIVSEKRIHVDPSRYLSKWAREAEVRRCCCIKCGEPLCINCRIWQIRKCGVNVESANT